MNDTRMPSFREIADKIEEATHRDTLIARLLAALSHLSHEQQVRVICASFDTDTLERVVISRERNRVALDREESYRKAMIAAADAFAREEARWLAKRRVYDAPFGISDGMDRELRRALEEEDDT